VFDAFKLQTASIFELDFSQSLQFNLTQQLLKLSQALNHQVGRAVLVVMAEQRETAAAFFREYLLPRREQMRKLIQLAIQRGSCRFRIRSRLFRSVGKICSSQSIGP